LFKEALGHPAECPCIRAFGDKFLHGREADARAAASDDGDLAVQRSSNGFLVIESSASPAPADARGGIDVRISSSIPPDVYPFHKHDSVRLPRGATFDRRTLRRQTRMERVAQTAPTGQLSKAEQERISMPDEMEGGFGSPGSGWLINHTAEIAAVTLLGSDPSSYVTGIELYASGGVAQV
jgi:hypothetical protein